MNVTHDVGCAKNSRAASYARCTSNDDWLQSSSKYPNVGHKSASLRECKALGVRAHRSSSDITGGYPADNWHHRRYIGGVRLWGVVVSFCDSHVRTHGRPSQTNSPVFQGPGIHTSLPHHRTPPLGFRCPYSSAGSVLEASRCVGATRLKA